MSDTTTASPAEPAEPAEPACLVCADGPEECRSCDGAGEDPGGYDTCSTCGGTGAAIPEHCCDCGGSPYCRCCSRCGAPNAGRCPCPMVITTADGRTVNLPSPDALITMAEIGAMAGVGRAAVDTWRRRHDDFPPRVGGTDESPTFSQLAVARWLTGHGITLVSGVTPAERDPDDEAYHQRKADMDATPEPTEPPGPYDN